MSQNEYRSAELVEVRLKVRNNPAAKPALLVLRRESAFDRLRPTV
jgi:hypothetical protein